MSFCGHQFDRSPPPGVHHRHIAGGPKPCSSITLAVSSGRRQPSSPCEHEYSSPDSPHTSWPWLSRIWISVEGWAIVPLFRSGPAGSCRRRAGFSRAIGFNQGTPVRPSIFPPAFLHRHTRRPGQSPGGEIHRSKIRVIEQALNRVFTRSSPSPGIACSLMKPGMSRGLVIRMFSAPNFGERHQVGGQ